MALDCAILKFVRHVRTASSDVFLLWVGEIRVGQLSLHHDQSLHCDLLIEIELQADDYSNLIGEIYSFLGAVYADDTMLTTWTATEREFYSNIIDYDYQPPLRRDLKEIGRQIGKFTGKHNRLRGQMTENIVEEYFEHQKHQVRKGSATDDANKIDLIAENESSCILIQCKAGAISKSDIANCVSKMAKFVSPPKKELMFAFVAKSFPISMEFERVQFEQKAKCKILCISEAAIVQALPQYRHSLS